MSLAEPQTGIFSTKALPQPSETAVAQTVCQIIHIAH